VTRAIRPATAAALLIVFLPALAAALSVGQQDTFEDGTTAGWTVALLGAAHPAPPANAPTGGPAGLDDNFLLLTAVGGGGAGNRLTVINAGQWTGDFIAAGISGIRMDLTNLGQSDLALRLLFSDPAGGPPTNQAFSTTPFLLPSGSGWTSAFFPIAPADLTASLGSVTAALHDTTDLRLYHSAPAAFPGPAVVALLGVDNVTATAALAPTPEPTSALLLGSGLVALSWRAWRRRARA
jgi:hypothetical protein